MVELLTGKIHGVDINGGAARVAVFGLYLALLEQVDPPTIWSTVRLPRLLGKNILVEDAFAEHELAARQFDIVVGNPPWSSRLTRDARAFLARAGVAVADEQIAQAFLWLARSVLRPGGVLGLVMPSKPLLHNRGLQAAEFRRQVFRLLQVRTVIDLSAIRRDVFSNATAPAAVLVATASAAAEEDRLERPAVLHLAVHPRPASAAVDALVIAPEEITSVPSKRAASRPEIWKALLWGSSRDLDLLDRLRTRYRAVGDYATDLGWTVGQGFQRGGGDANPALELQGMPVIEYRDIRPLQLVDRPRPVFTEASLHRPRSPELYQPPLVLVRRTVVDGRLAAILIDSPAVFNNAIVGLAGTTRDRPLLQLLAAATSSSLGRYWHFFTSSSWGVERDFVELNEHLALPLTEPTADQTRALGDLFVRAQMRGLDPLLSQELDDLIFDAYDLSDSDIKRVYDGLEYGLERFYSSSREVVEVSEDDASRYAVTIASTLASAFPDLSFETSRSIAGPYMTVAVTMADRQAGIIGPGRKVDGVVDIDALIATARSGADTRSSGIVAQTSALLVDDQTVYFVKTLDRDRWSPDAALDDAGRVIGALAVGDVTSAR